MLLGVRVAVRIGGVDGSRRAGAAERLARAKARLDALTLYPRPVSLRRVRVVTVPAFFRLPLVRRFDGYAAWSLILLRRPLSGTSDDLLTHELCHVWQMQHHPVRMPLSYVRRGYDRSAFEAEARRAVAETRTAPSRPGTT